MTLRGFIKRMPRCQFTNLDSVTIESDDLYNAFSTRVIIGGRFQGAKLARSLEAQYPGILSSKVVGFYPNVKYNVSIDDLAQPAGSIIESIMISIQLKEQKEECNQTEK